MKTWETTSNATEDSTMTTEGWNDQWNSDNVFVCSDKSSINYPLQSKSQNISQSIAVRSHFNINVHKKYKLFKWWVTSSGFSLVIRAAITWPLGQGTWAEFSKSMGASPQGGIPYITRISLILYRGIPMAIWKVTKHTSFIFSYFP